MKLFTFDPAPNPRRVNLFLAWKGIELPTVQVSLRELDQFQPEYRALNPRCVVPALQLDDGSVLCDGIAICWYLESLYPQRPLLGTTPLQQAQIMSWDQFIYTDGFLPIADALRNYSAAFKDRAVTGTEPVAQIEALVARGRQRLHVFWDALDRHLAQRQFVVGDSLTFADIDAFVTVEFAAWIKEKIPEERAHLRTWYERVKTLLPAV